MLEDIETGDTHFARAGREKAGQDAHRGGFSGTVLAEESDDFALAHFEGNVFDSDVTCVSLGQAFDFNHNGYTF